ncbi:glutamate racemase [Daejeonella oryzae]|uniref:glutamate racemase n=1 Tax=Daejeonella oryzae TaxID=1122943 RepID=UPI00040EE109|nr:glutamate racemase [Daejeonella oryzae]
MSSNQPIGIFDSGIGGLTVANAIHKILPNEQLIYFGDTAHLPYGDKSPEAIRSYSLKIGRFLLDQNCKLIVIACNTASSHAYTKLVEAFADKVHIVNVIDPVVDFLADNKAFQKIGVIGTKSTINSGVYTNKLKIAAPAKEVSALATPLLAPMIEEGFYNNNISHTVIRSYLSSPELYSIDTLVLACTHYPLIQKEIDEYFNGKVTIINTAKIVAEHIKNTLVKLDLLNGGIPADHQFFVSDFTSSFENSTRLFFGEQIHLKLKNIWE